MDTFDLMQIEKNDHKCKNLNDMCNNSNFEIENSFVYTCKFD